MVKLAWCCDNCNRLVISDSKEHHKMDFCSCGDCGCDLEDYLCRWSAKDFLKLRVLGELGDKGHWKFYKHNKHKKNITGGLYRVKKEMKAEIKKKEKRIKWAYCYQ